MLHLQGRRAASSLASCFSQFAHKSTTVFQVVLSFALSFVFLKYSPGLHTIKQTASLLVLLIACKYISVNFQTNAKLEAELVHLREELTEARGLREVAERERQEAVRLLQVDLFFVVAIFE